MQCVYDRFHQAASEGGANVEHFGLESYTSVDQQIQCVSKFWHSTEASRVWCTLHPHERPVRRSEGPERPG